MSSLKTLTTRRTLLQSIGLGGAAVYGMTLQTHAQSFPQELSETQYKEINEVIKGARETYSLLCLAPSTDLNEVENKFLSLQAKIDAVIVLEAESISELNQNQPWTLANFSSQQIKEFNFISGTQLLATKDELFSSFSIDSYRMIMDGPTPLPIVETTERYSALRQTPPELSDSDFHRDSFLSYESSESELSNCLSSITIILAEIFNINNDHIEELTSIIKDTNSQIYLEGMIKSIITADFNKLKTFTELFLDEFDKDPILYDFFKTATSPVAVAILEWIAKRCVPIIGLSLALLEILFTLIRHRERVYLCYTSVE